jgi:hypothetical protein
VMISLVFGPLVWLLVAMAPDHSRLVLTLLLAYCISIRWLSEVSFHLISGLVEKVGLTAIGLTEKENIFQITKCLRS